MGNIWHYHKGLSNNLATIFIFCALVNLYEVNLFKVNWYYLFIIISINPKQSEDINKKLHLQKMQILYHLWLQIRYWVQVLNSLVKLWKRRAFPTAKQWIYWSYFLPIDKNFLTQHWLCGDDNLTNNLSLLLLYSVTKYILLTKRFQKSLILN